LKSKLNSYLSYVSTNEGGRREIGGGEGKSFNSLSILFISSISPHEGSVKGKEEKEGGLNLSPARLVSREKSLEKKEKEKR